MAEKKSTKAALLSALVFPGAGLWWLKQYTRALIFIIPATITLWFVCAGVYDAFAPIYIEMLDKSAEGLIGPTDIFSQATQMSAKIHQKLDASKVFTTSKYILIVSWLWSIVSSYFAGKKLEP